VNALGIKPRGVSPLLCLALLATGCAGAQRPAGAGALCLLTHAPNPPTPRFWTQLLLHGHRGMPDELPPELDCSGNAILWPAASSDAAKLQPARPLTDHDVVTFDARGRTRLVWVMSRRYASGEALGPVALVEQAGEGWAVRALGTLRAHAEKPRLRLERSGVHELLIAEGERCRGPEGTPCDRFAQVLPLRGNRFVAEPIFEDELGEKLVRAWIPLLRTEAKSDRRVELATTLTFDPRGLVAHEVLVETELAAAPGSPTKVMRKAQLDRRVRVELSRLVAEGPTLGR
jgi:hypothetical protein